MLIIAVDFDGTLCLGNKSHITASEPNYPLKLKLQKIKKELNAHIKIVTARGSKNSLDIHDKQKKYLPLIKQFCALYNIPYDEISFNKEYAHLYIDDMTIDQNADFFGYNSIFTKNKLIFTDKTVVKYCKSALLEKEWYTIADHLYNTPEVLFCNDELIITKKIQKDSEPTINDIIELLYSFKSNQIKNFHFQTYLNNIKVPNFSSKKTIEILSYLPECEPTFFHGDLTNSNVVVNDKKLFLIDPNYKYIFGNYLTDAGKAFFGLVAYNFDYSSAKKIVDEFGKDVLRFAVSEGSRVCKYKPEYISIVNNISDLIL